jgi:PAS domain S-box-containing protein
VKSFFFRSIFITLLTISLFVVAIFLIVMPTLERSILEQKREMIRELTTSAWNILAKFQNDEQSGRLTQQQAQQQSIEQIRNLHYGHEMKDYFWINDMHPRMVNHPYRTDLDGKDLSTYSDPDGKKPFVEFVRIVREKGAGYFTYRWQWKDDVTRVVPKVSYVKGFKPWNWIIGTGVYLDDVHREIRQMKQQLVIVSLLILGIAATLQFFLVLEGYRTEKSRHRAEKALRASEEKYRTLVESAGERIIMIPAGETLFANQAMLTWLGYTAEEFQGLKPEDILEASEPETTRGGYYFQSLLRGEEGLRRYETRIRHKSGEYSQAVVSLSPFRLRDRHGLILTASDITFAREREAAQERVLAELNASLGFLNQTCGHICTPIEIAANNAISLQEALERPENQGSRLLFRGDSNFFGLGFSAGHHPFADGSPALNHPVSEFLVPYQEIDEQAPIYDAYERFFARDCQPMLVVNNAGKPLGAIDFRNFVQLGDYSPTLLHFQIAQADSPETLVRLNRRFPEIVKVLFRSGANTHYINQIITHNADLILKRAVEFSMRDHGTPPARFAFMVMGSEGRCEQTLATDQDNALIYEDVPDHRTQETRRYFLEMGDFVCGLMAQAGYSLCEGQVMARNEKWCGPLTYWRTTFTDWIGTSEAEDLLQAKIFFDFRCGFGEQKLVTELRESLWASLNSMPQFFFLLARNVLIFQPPVGLFGHFSLTRTPDGREALDIKGVMALIVDFARIYALKYRIPDVNTVGRLNALRKLGHLSDQAFDEMVQAYGHLMKLRLDNQIRSMRENLIPDNFLVPAHLTSIDQKVLREIFDHIKNFQVRLSYDFTGTASSV